MKITKNQRIETLELKVAGLTTMLTMLQVWSDHADNMLNELNHALPDPEYDAKCEAQEADIDASLDRHRERLGLNKPQLKKLDQSVFDGLDNDWQWAAVDGCTGRAYVYEQKPHFFSNKDYWRVHDGLQRITGTGYDTTDWQNSLIERDDIAKELLEVDLSSELTGSELCKAMLARGDKYVLCYASDLSDKYAVENRGRINLMTHTDGDGIFSNRARWRNAVPINQRTGEPLTASEVGL